MKRGVISSAAQKAQIADSNIIYGLPVELAQHMLFMTRPATVSLHSLGFSSSKGRLHLQGQRTDKAIPS